MTTIILTCTVNVGKNIMCVFQREPKDRIQSYLSGILQWLYKTNFHIILVENSGYAFNELNKEKEIFKDRFELLVYTENELEDALFLQNTTSKGRCEIFAINYAFENSIKIHNSNFIIKITGRYFIPELEEYLSNYDLNNYDCLTQQNKDRCEMVGSHYKNFMSIFDVFINTDHIEDEWKERLSKYQNILTCKTFKINETQRGGQGDKYSNI